MAQFSKIVWLAAVRRDCRIGATERLVIQEIGDTANLGGFGAWKSTEQIMETLAVGRATVTRARHSATDLGYLKPVKHAQGGRNKTVHYNLEMPS